MKKLYKMNFNEKMTKKTKLIIVFSCFILIITAIATPLAISYSRYLKAIDFISLNSAPSTIEYYIGENIDYSGLKIQVTKNNGDIYFVNADDCEISGFDSSMPTENQVVTVKYKGFTCTFDVIIKELPQSVSVLVGIYLETLPKTEYKVGENLDTTGGVIVREYKDGSTSKISLVNNYVYNFSSNKPGEYILNIIYIENGLQAETSYTIVVTE